MKTSDLIKKYPHVFTTDYTQDPDCIAAYLMNIDEDPLTDSSIQGNDAALKGAGEPDFASATPPKPYSLGYYDWDGVNDYAQDGTFAGAGEKCSIVTWIRAASDGEDNQGRIWQSRDSGTAKHNLRTESEAGGAMEIRWSVNRNVNSQENAKSNDAPVTVDAWAHIAATAETGADLKIFVDGVEVSYEYQDFCNDVLNTFNQSYIGNVDTGGTRTYDGDMTQFALFDRVLDSTEINAIMDNGLRGEVANPYPVSLLRKDVITGYHCFMNAYIKAKIGEYDPLKLPDGTTF